MELLVLRDRVEVPGVRRRDELDLLAHGLDLLPFAAHARDDGVDALLVDRAESRRRHAQAHPPSLALHPEPLRTQVRLEEALRLVVRVRDLVSRPRPLPRDLTDSGHLETPSTQSR